MSDYYKEYYQKNKEKILFRVKNNYVKRKFNKYEQPMKDKEFMKEEPKKEEEKEKEKEKEKIKKNIIVTF